MFTSKVFVFFVCLSAFCEVSIAQTVNSLHPLPNVKSELYLMMKTTACFDGGCPVYNLEIHFDGKVIFEGIENTKTEGKTESNLSEEKLNQLSNEVNKSGFFNLKNVYTKVSGVCPFIFTDNPIVILTIKLNGKEKTITHYLGCREEFKFGDSSKVFPQELYNLENKIDEISETKRWIGERK